jgi:hypothetical protein
VTTHPPRHRLEELLAGSLRDAKLRGHVDACAECTARLSAMNEARAAFVGHRDPTSFARLVADRGGLRKQKTSLLRRAGFGLAAAAIVLLGARLAMPEPAAVRFKGPANLEVFVHRNGQTQPVENGQALAAGDQLAFVYTLAEAQSLLLLSIDESGAVTRYFPSESGAAVLSPAARAQLPVGIELDAHHGEERLFALFSRAPIDEPRAREALRQALRDARARGVGIAGMTRPELPAQQSSVWFRKP